MKVKAAAAATSGGTGQRIRRPSRSHQSRRQGGEGRPALRLRRPRRGRRSEGPRRLRPWQGARSARSDPQGDRRRQARPRARAAARRAARCITTCTAVTARARSCCARLLPAPASSPAARCARSSRSLGVHDVVAKSQGSSNPYNMVRATFDALQQEDSPRSVAQRRNIKVSTLQSRRQGVEADAADS